MSKKLFQLNTGILRPEFTAHQWPTGHWLRSAALQQELTENTVLVHLQVQDVLRHVPVHGILVLSLGATGGSRASRLDSCLALVEPGLSRRTIFLRIFRRWLSGATSGTVRTKHTVLVRAQGQRESSKSLIQRTKAPTDIKSFLLIVCNAADLFVNLAAG